MLEVTDKRGVLLLAGVLSDRKLDLVEGQYST
jgi:hypothetical protein